MSNYNHENDDIFECLGINESEFLDKYNSIVFCEGDKNSQHVEKLVNSFSAVELAYLALNEFSKAREYKTKIELVKSLFK